MFLLRAARSGHVPERSGEILARVPRGAAERVVDQLGSRNPEPLEARVEVVVAVVREAARPRRREDGSPRVALRREAHVAACAGDPNPPQDASWGEHERFGEHGAPRGARAAVEAAVSDDVEMRRRRPRAPARECRGARDGEAQESPFVCEKGRSDERARELPFQNRHRRRVAVIRELERPFVERQGREAPRGVSSDRDVRRRGVCRGGRGFFGRKARGDDLHRGVREAPPVAVVREDGGAAFVHVKRRGEERLASVETYGPASTGLEGRDPQDARRRQAVDPA